MPTDDGTERGSVSSRREWVANRSAVPPHWRRGMIGGQEPATLRSTEGRGVGSRLLHRLGDVTSHAATGLSVAAMVLGWLALGVSVGFPSWWAAILQVVASAITLVMVFTIQHTQTRQQSATQRKLDELLRAQPSADNRLIAVEQAADAELAALADLNLADRHQARPPAEGAVPPASDENSLPGRGRRPGGP